MKIGLSSALLVLAISASASAQAISEPVLAFKVESRTATSVLLSWPDTESFYGTPFPAYEIRYLAYAQIVNPANPNSAANNAFNAQWDTDAALSSGAPTPVGSGATVFCDVTGLTMGTTYYFKLHALWLSEPGPDGEQYGHLRYGLCSGATLLDPALPAKVTGLAWRGGSESTLRIEWTSPREDAGDNTSGPVTSYEVFFAPAVFVSEITPASLASTTKVVIHAVSAPGSTETFEIGGIQHSTDFSIALRGIDDAGQAGPLSATLLATTGASTSSGSDSGPSCGGSAAGGGLALLPAALLILLTCRPGNRTLGGCGRRRRC